MVKLNGRMNHETSVNAFTTALRRLIDKHRDSPALSYAAVIGCLQSECWLLMREAEDLAQEE